MYSLRYSSDLNGHSRLPECTVLGELADFIHHRAGPWTFRAWPARRPALIKASVAHMFSRPFGFTSLRAVALAYLYFRH